MNNQFNNLTNMKKNASITKIMDFIENNFEYEEIQTLSFEMAYKIFEYISEILEISNTFNENFILLNNEFNWKSNKLILEQQQKLEKTYETPIEKDNQQKQTQKKEFIEFTKIVITNPILKKLLIEETKENWNKILLLLLNNNVIVSMENVFSIKINNFKEKIVFVKTSNILNNKQKVSLIQQNETKFLSGIEEQNIINILLEESKKKMVNSKKINQILNDLLYFGSEFKLYTHNDNDIWYNIENLLHEYNLINFDISNEQKQNSIASFLIG